MFKKDYYEVLDLKNNCTSKDVKKNFHKLALVWHPDKHADKGQAEVKFKEIHEAYCVLMDENKRKIYDTRGHAGLINPHDKKNFNPFDAENFFTAGCFNNSKKSPFEIFRDIFKDNDDDEDDDFYKTFNEYDPCGMSNLINKNVKSFLNDAFQSSDEDEDTESFFRDFKPSFMDENFFSAPVFKTCDYDSQNGTCSASEVFSQFFPSKDAEPHSYSRTSSTVCNSHGNCKTSVKEIFKRGDKVFEKERNFTFDAKSFTTKKEECCLNKKRGAKPIGAKNKDFIVIEDSDGEDNEEPRMKNGKPVLEKCPINRKVTAQQAQQNSCIFNNDNFAYEVNASDDDFNLLFRNMDRLGAFKRNKQI